MTMTVGDLIKVLEDFPDGTPVVLSRDSEGNTFSCLEDWTKGWYNEHRQHWTHIGSVTEMFTTDDTVLALTLWPEN